HPGCCLQRWRDAGFLCSSLLCCSLSRIPRQPSHRLRGTNTVVSKRYDLCGTSFQCELVPPNRSLPSQPTPPPEPLSLERGPLSLPSLLKPVSQILQPTRWLRADPKDS